MKFRKKEAHAPASRRRFQTADKSRRTGEAQPKRTERQTEERIYAPASHRRFRTAAGYFAGALGLGLAVTAALVLPEVYNRWQDAALLGAVYTESREGIEFIDISSLDKAGKMEMLGQVTQVQSIGSYYDETYDTYGFSVEDEEYSASYWREKAAGWVDCGLLPGFVLDVMTEDTMSENERVYLVTDQGTLSLYSVEFSLDMVNEEEGWSTVWQTVELIMDAETEMLYAVLLREYGDGVIDGEEIRELLKTQVAGKDSLYDYLAEQIGYDSFDAACLAWQNEQEGAGDMQRAALDASQYDFATPCGASSASLTGVPGTLSMDVELTYDTFTGKAYRRVLSEGGLAVMYGSLLWLDFMGSMTTTDSLLFGDGSTSWAVQEQDFVLSCDDPYMELYLENWGLTDAAAVAVESPSDAA